MRKMRPANAIMAVRHLQGGEEMNCPECVKECKEQGGLCYPPDFESRQAAKEMGT